MWAAAQRPTADRSAIPGESLFRCHDVIRRNFLLERVKLLEVVLLGVMQGERHSDSDLFLPPSLRSLRYLLFICPSQWRQCMSVTNRALTAPGQLNRPASQQTNEPGDSSEDPYNDADNRYCAKVYVHYLHKMAIQGNGKTFPISW